MQARSPSQHLLQQKIASHFQFRRGAKTLAKKSFPLLEYNATLADNSRGRIQEESRLAFSPPCFQDQLHAFGHMTI